jgi:hypothetical protein
MPLWEVAFDKLVHFLHALNGIPSLLYGLSHLVSLMCHYPALVLMSFQWLNLADIVHSISLMKFFLNVTNEFTM